MDKAKHHYDNAQQNDQRIAKGPVSYTHLAAADGLTQQDQLKYNTDALTSFMNTGSADAVACYMEDMGFTIMEGYLQLKADGQTPVILPLPDLSLIHI